MPEAAAPATRNWVLRCPIHTDVKGLIDRINGDGNTGVIVRVAVVIIRVRTRQWDLRLDRQSLEHHPSLLRLCKRQRLRWAKCGVARLGRA